MSRTDTCRSCGAPIRWAISEKGRRMPVDTIPVIGGNIVLRPQQHRDPLALYIKPDPAIKRFVSHFVTCRDARKWRKP